MRNLNCLRCQTAMHLIKSEKIQLGQTGWFLGDLPNLMAGAMEVDFYACPQCGKIELFQSEAEKKENEIAQVKCPRCGRVHDFDDPKCPFCQYRH